MRARNPRALASATQGLHSRATLGTAEAINRSVPHIDAQGEVIERCTILTTTPNSSGRYSRSNASHFAPGQLRSLAGPGVWRHGVGFANAKTLRLGADEAVSGEQRINYVGNDDADRAKLSEFDPSVQSSLFLMI
jgi:hypothetical protein